MSMRPIRATFGLAIALVATAVGAASADRVTVRYEHPENFTESREVRAFAPSRNGSAYQDPLKRYIEKRATPMLSAGQALDVAVTDVDRAGSYLPSIGSAHRVRVVEALYPPRINLHFRLLDSQGQVVREGERKLTDLSFLSADTAGMANTDPLRYEKRLIDRWLAKGPTAL